MKNPKKKIVFVFFVWGEEYIERLCNLLLKNIDIEISESTKLFNKFNIIFKFYTTQESFQDIQNSFIKYKYLNKYCNLKIKEFDKLSKYFNKRNKYKLLGSLQTISIIDNISSDYIFFLYPDFLFKIGSIKNILSNLKDYDIFYTYCPQVIEEEVLKQINTNSFNYFLKNIEKIILKYLHPIVKACELDTKRFNHASNLSIIKKDHAIFKNFHLHPTLIKISVKHRELFKSSNISFDEDFFDFAIDKNLKIYYPKNSDEMMFCSLFERNAVLLPKVKMTHLNVATWILQNAYPIHYKNVSNTFTLKTKNNDKNEVKKSISRIENFVNTVLEYINRDDLFDRIYYRKDPLFVIASLNSKKRNLFYKKENILNYHDKSIDNIFSKNKYLTKKNFKNLYLSELKNLDISVYDSISNFIN